MAFDYDFIVIGSGPAGQKGAIQAAKLGKKVALVDRGVSVGGVCLHTGTIPSKTTREAVLYLSGYAQRGLYGQSYRLKSDITIADVQQRLQMTIQKEAEVIMHQLQRNGVHVLSGTATFMDEHTIQVTSAHGKTTTIRGDYFLIATGTHPVQPSLFSFDGKTVMDSDQILLMNKIPRSMTVIGGGVIGVEYAAIYSAMDVDVTLIDGRDQLLGFMDREIIDEMIYQFRQRGMTIRTGENVASVTHDSDGMVVTELQSGKKVRSEVLLVAAGRSGSTKTLQPEMAGVEQNDRHIIPVNDNYQTSRPHIYAAGDIIGFPSLASTSMEQGRLAACHAFGHGDSKPLHNFPFGIYAVPEMSMVGKTEQQLTADGIAYETGIARLRETGRGQIMGLEHGMLKMLFDMKNRSLLGVHIIGEGATELIHIGQAAMVLHATLDYFIDNVFNYPTLAEAYKMAALDAWNRMGM